MRALVTGATGFLGGHVARLLHERGDTVRVAYRDPDKLSLLKGVEFERRKTDVTDPAAMRKALRDCDLLFHIAGYVGSSPEHVVWELNAVAPRLAVEAAAKAGVRRVVLTSTISAVGTAVDGRPADEGRDFPEGGMGLTYPDSKHEGEERAKEAGEALDVEVVAVNPSYILGVPVDPSQPGENSTRMIGNYLRGRLPGVLNASMNFVSVDDAAQGHLLAADKGKPGERYILGGENMTWAELIDQVARVSGIHHPLLVLPNVIKDVARLRESLRIPGTLAAEGFELMANDWRFSSAKARDELGYEPRPLSETIQETVDWYLDLIDQGQLEEREASPLSTMAAALRVGERLGLVQGLHAVERVAGRRLVAGA
jgi:dihydroflavonol-4-reductase